MFVLASTSKSVRFILGKPSSVSFVSSIEVAYEGSSFFIIRVCVVLPIIPHYTCEERGIDVYEVQRLALEYIATLEDAIADPALIGTDRGGTAGWTLRVSTYPFETQEELLERVKAAVFSEYENRLRYHSKVRLHVWIDEHPSYEGDYFLHILYN